MRGSGDIGGGGPWDTSRKPYCGGAPEGWWHAHYNVGPEPWDWLRVGWGSEKPKPGGGTYDYSRTPQEGGDQMAFEDMDPAFHREFEQELAKAGINLELISTSEIKISVVIAKDKADEAARVVHAAFDLDKL